MHPTFFYIFFFSVGKMVAHHSHFLTFMRKPLKLLRFSGENVR
jgi:hypothetical protein